MASVMSVLRSPVASPVVVVVSGPPGVGKTALGVHVAHQVVDGFPDGQVYLTHGDGTDADGGQQLDSVLRALGVDGSAIPEALPAKASLFRSRIAGRRILVVADNAASHRQVELLVPPQGPALVVTSRLPLTALPGVTLVDLSPLTRRSHPAARPGRQATPAHQGRLH